MQGRVEHKIETESKIQNKIKNYPEYMKQFYYSLNQKSHTTKLRYICNVIRFLEFVDIEKDIDYNDQKDLAKIDSFIIEEYISSINYYNKKKEIKELSNATKACIYASLNAFFLFLTRHDYIENNPFSNGKIIRPKINDGEIVFLTPEEVKLVENQIIRGVGNKQSVGRQRRWKFRDYLLFRIPVINGIRVSALNEINIDDINFDKKIIRVTEKGNITKDVFFDDKTEMFIHMWIEEREKIIGSDNDCKALFISNRKQRMTVRSIERIIEKYTSEAVPDKHITPHKLRSTCGTNLYQAKKDIYLVANVLGHKSTAPTRKYTKVFETDKRDAIETMADLYR